METKQHATKKTNGSMRKSKGKLKKYLKTNDDEDTTSQNQYSEGNSEQYRPSSKKKKNLKSTT